MISMFAFFIAAAAAPPPPQGVVSFEDYPPAALRRGEQGPVYFQLVVNPEGRVDSCSILLSSGSKDLDDASCRIVTARARFSPAQDDNGTPIYGTYRQVITWRIGNYRSAQGLPPAPNIPPDLDLTINQAPQGVKLPLQTKVSFHVSADGKASTCKQADDVIEPAPQVLVDAACNAVLQSRVEVIRDHNNKPVDASTNATVRFTLDKRVR